MRYAGCAAVDSSAQLSGKLNDYSKLISPSPMFKNISNSLWSVKNTNGINYDRREDVFMDKARVGNVKVEPLYSVPCFNLMT